MTQGDDQINQIDRARPPHLVPCSECREAWQRYKIHLTAPAHPHRKHNEVLHLGHRPRFRYQRPRLDRPQKVNNLNLDKSTCNTGLGQIASKCEKCARTGIECLRYPDMKKDLCEGGVDSPHSKNCNGCIDKIFELLN